MAVTRRFNQRSTGNIWPGFVDAMTALLLVLFFVLTIFMVMQSVLSEQIEVKDTELDSLTVQLSDLADALGLERTRTQTLSETVGALSATLDDAEAQALAQDTLIATLTAQIDTAEAAIAERDARISGFEDRVAALLSENQSLGQTLSDRTGERDSLSASLAEVEAARDVALSEAEALNLALARMRTEMDSQVEAARLAAARSDALEALVADLQAEQAAQETRLSTLLAQIAAAEADQLALRSALSDAEIGLENEAARRAALEADLASQTEAFDAAELARLEAQARLAELRETVADQAAALDAAELSRLEDLARLEELRATVADQSAELDAAEAVRLAELAAAEALRARLDTSEGALSEAEAARLAEAAAAEALRARLENADAELTAMTLALEERRQEAEDTLTKLAAAELAREQLSGELADASARAEDLSQRLTAAQRDRLLLGLAQRQLSQVEAQSAEDARRVAVLNEQVAALRSQLNGLQGLLDVANAKDAEAQVQIQALGTELNTALARVAAEQRARANLEEAERLRLEAEAQNLERFRSEFFGQLRDLLGDQEGVRISGDRFVFSSSVLFDTGAVELSEQGQAEVAKVAGILREVADRIPSGIDWVLRVDGHTDNVPIFGGGKYADNWELSQGRALSVVRYMIEDLGIPPGRLAPTGFGEYQPVSLADTPEGRALNRRIELKFTEK
ncbi:peptidoglycan -binding protein [Dinoroseobacter sp. S124A]|uniref:peptidoglycan -binding protein n=1 Tax=Dinoroseobacter sp. S124A TaxID=3415128 RepID=UPI003C7D32A7